MTLTSLVEALEADLRLLSNEARKGEGLAASISSWFANGEGPDIPEEASKALLILRQQKNGAAWPEAVQQDILRPFLLALKVRKSPVITAALAAIQKLLSEGVLAPSSVPELVAAVNATHNERKGDETVQLKKLQTLLTLLQSNAFPQTEEDLCHVLAICFALLESPKSTESVSTTAAATVRQAITVVFDRAYIELRPPLDDAPSAPPPRPAPHPSPAPANSAARLLIGRGVAATGAYMLMQDLIMLACGSPGGGAWMKIKSPPPVLILELLEHILAKFTPLFLGSEMFRRALTEEICGLVARKLAEPVPDDPSPVVASESRLVLKMAATICRFMWPIRQVPVQSLVSALTKAGLPDSPGWYQVLALQSLKRVLGDPRATYFLSTIGTDGAELPVATPSASASAATASSQPLPSSQPPTSGSSGMRDDSACGASSRATSPPAERRVDLQRSNVLAQAVLSLCDDFEVVIRFMTQQPGMDGVDVSTAISRAFSHHQRGRGLELDEETPAEIRTAVHVGVSTVECVLELIGALDSWAVAIVEELEAPRAPATTAEVAGPPTPRDADTGGRAPLSRNGSLAPAGFYPGASLAPSEHLRTLALSRPHVEAAVMGLWDRLLSILNYLMGHLNGEDLVVAALQGYQRVLEFCGLLGLREPLEAFLTSLCTYALSAQPKRPLAPFPLPPTTARDPAATLAADPDLAPTADSSGLTPTPGDVPDAPLSPTAKVQGAISPLLEAARAVRARLQELRPRGAENALRDATRDLHPDEGRVLTQKNVQALRTLFNVALRLDTVLGSSWELVLETLDILDHVLYSPRTRTLEVSNELSTGGGGGDAGFHRSSDLAILSAAVRQLFAATSRMDPDTVLQMLQALQFTIRRGVARAARRPAPGARLFALGRLVDVTLNNVHRFNLVWPSLATGVMVVLLQPLEAIRALGIESLDRAVVGVIEAVGAPEYDAAYGPATVSRIERTVLRELEAQFAAVEHEDARAGLLRCLQHALQRHGDRLTEGWDPVLDLMACVARSPSPLLIPPAFKGFQLLCSDFVSTIPAEHRTRCAEVAAAFGRQTADLNVSLTSMSVLWNLADTFGRAWARGQEQADDAAAASVSSSDSRRDAEEGGRLFVSVYQELLDFSLDTRAEVRNAAVRTLSTLLLTYGNRMPTVMWQDLVVQRLFPVLERISALTYASSTEEGGQVVVGRERGRSVTLMVHHSRNSAQKQWDETLSLMMNSVGRLIRAHVAALVSVDGFGDKWLSYLRLLANALRTGRKELGCSAVQSLLAVTLAHYAHATAESDHDRTGIGLASLQALTDMIHACTVDAASGLTDIPTQVRLDLLRALMRMYGATADVSLRGQFLELAALFLRHPRGPSDAPHSAAFGLLPLHKAAFVEFYLAVIPDFRHDALWERMLEILAEVLQFTPPAPTAPQPPWIPDESPSDREATVTDRERAQDSASAALSPTSSQGASALSPQASFSPRDPTREHELDLEMFKLLKTRILDVLADLFGDTAAFPPLPPNHPLALPNAPSPAESDDTAEPAAGVDPVATEHPQESGPDGAPKNGVRRAQLPLGPRCRALATVLHGLEGCMASRATDPGAQLWQRAVHCFVAAVRSSHVPLNGWLATGAALPTDRHPWPLVVRCAEALLLDARAHLPRPESPLEASDRDQLQLISLHGPMAIELDLSGGAAGPVPTPEDPLAEAEAERARAESGDPDLQVIHILTQVLLAHPEFVPTETVRAAASLLDRGVERSAALVLRPGNEGRSFALHFLRGLFDVCDRPAQQRMHAGTASSVQHARCVEVVRLVLPVFAARCRRILEDYVREDAARAATEPVSAWRTEHVMCVFDVLASLRLVPEIADEFARRDAPISLGAPVATVKGGGGGAPAPRSAEAQATVRSVTHLLMVYGSLCRVVGVRDGLVRANVRALLLSAGQAIGLV